MIKSEVIILKKLNLKKDISKKYQNWLNDFFYMSSTEDWGILTYTFHPFVIGRGHRMIILEKLIKKLAAKGAEFMTMMDAAAEFMKKGS